MNRSAGSLTPRSLSRLGAKKLAPFPDAFPPQLATRAARPPSDSDGNWGFEIKFDGYRMRGRVETGEARLLTINGHDWTARLPLLQKALQSLPIASVWLDGEACIVDAEGKPDFSALQRAFATRKTDRIRFFAFDVLYLNGYDLRGLPLRDRRAILEQIFEGVEDESMQVSELFDQHPASLLDSACRMGLEGIMGKRLDRHYFAGRSSDWLKIKCAERQEFVVGGYTQSRGARPELRKLCLGVYEADGSMRFCGDVAVTLGARDRSRLATNLDEADSCPFYNPPSGGAIRWARPTVVVEVSFLEWTPAGTIRQAVLRGMREDKRPADVVDERPSHVDSATEHGARADSDARRPITVTHGSRVIDPTTGATKEDLVRYYEAIADWMLPHVARRPLSIVRAPAGLPGEMFFQKYAEGQRLKAVTELPRELHPGHPPLLTIESAEGLAELAQLNAIELHTWNATAPQLAKPDRVVFDLDPDPSLPWQTMVEAALLVKTLLDQLHLQGFCKTSGGKGLHIVVPLVPERPWGEVKAFALAVAKHLGRVIPQRFVSVSGPKNRVGKIFVDYLRNGRGATTAEAFSVRARPGLGVSVPIAWDEIEELRSADQWNIATVVDRQRALPADPWRDYWSAQQTLTENMYRALGAS